MIAFLTIMQMVLAVLCSSASVCFDYLPPRDGFCQLYHLALSKLLLNILGLFESSVMYCSLVGIRRGRIVGSIWLCQASIANLSSAEPRCVQSWNFVSLWRILLSDGKPVLRCYQMSEQDWEPLLTVLSLCGEHCAVGPSTSLTSWLLAVKVPALCRAVCIGIWKASLR